MCVCVCVPQPEDGEKVLPNKTYERRRAERLRAERNAKEGAGKGKASRAGEGDGSEKEVRRRRTACIRCSMHAFVLPCMQHASVCGASSNVLCVRACAAAVTRHAVLWQPQMAQAGPQVHEHGA